MTSAKETYREIKETGPLPGLAESSRLFSLYLRLPIMAGSRNALPLTDFLHRAVFMEKAGSLYWTEQFGALSGSDQRRLIQILEDPLGIHAVLVLAEDHAVLFGPFVTAPYQEKTSRRLLSRFVRCDESLLLRFKLFWCDLALCELDSVIRAAQSMLEYTGFALADFPVVRRQPPKPPVRSTAPADAAELPAWRPDALEKVEERYAVESELTAAIAAGNKEAALSALSRILRTSRPQVGMTVDVWTAESASAIMRSMIRLAAKQSPLSAAVIDGISLDYAQKMRRLSDNPRKSAYLYRDMISDLCEEIRRLKEQGFSPLTQRALHLIQKHHAEPVTIGNIARMLRVSESTLARSLRSDTGHSFTQLLKNERMSAAARLLTNTEEPIQAIAAMVGIPDQNYFVKVFRSVYQVTPSEFRNSGHQG